MAKFRDDNIDQSRLLAITLEKQLSPNTVVRLHFFNSLIRSGENWRKQYG